MRFELKVIVKTRQDLDNLSAMVTDLEIPSNCCNEPDLTELNLRRFPLLRRIRVGDMSCVNVTRFEVDGLNRLESIHIGYNSFTHSIDRWPIATTDSEFHLRNCNRLQVVEIDPSSFADYYLMELKSLPSLHFLRLGNETESSCFSSAPDVSFIGSCDDRE